MTKRRFSISTGLALVMTLVIATGAMAGTATDAWKLRDVCTLSGGYWGYGKAVLKVAAGEYGRSGVNKIKFDAYLVESESATGPWTAIDRVRDATPYFPNTSADSIWEFKSVFHFLPEDQGMYHRIETYVRFVKTDGTNRLIDIRVLDGKTC